MHKSKIKESRKGYKSLLLPPENEGLIKIYLGKHNSFLNWAI